jgi:hypothetical protein
MYGQKDRFRSDVIPAVEARVQSCNVDGHALLDFANLKARLCNQGVMGFSTNVALL